MMTVAAVVDAGTARLRRAGFSRDDARRDAVVLARGILHWSLADWLARSGTTASVSFQQAFEVLLGRRCEHEPIAYLLGTREFYGRPFGVTRDTLIPRPETEGLVDAALAWLERNGRHRGDQAVRIVDVGTGTGCVAITIALEASMASRLDLTATDISTEALAVARDNAARLGATGVHFRPGSLLEGIPGPVDLIVSNPPYVPATDRDTLQPDVVRFEPPAALFGGDDGLDVIRPLIPAAREALAPHGALMLEIGMGQADGVVALLAAAGFAPVERHRDLQGYDRILVAHQPGPSL